MTKRETMRRYRSGAYSARLVSPDQAAMQRLSDAIRHVEQHHPLPRCEHGKPLRDGGGELLEPPCGCRLTVGQSAEPEVK